MGIIIGPPLLPRQPLLTNERAKRRSQGTPHSTYSKSRSLPLAFAVGARISTTVSDGRGGGRGGLQAGASERMPGALLTVERGKVDRRRGHVGTLRSA